MNLQIDKNDNKIRVVYFMTGKMGPYHLSRFLRLAEVYQEFFVGNILQKGYFRPWKDDLGSLKERVVYIGSGQENLPDHKLIPSVKAFLEGKKPEVVIAAGYDPVQMAAARWAKRNGAACILHADTWRGIRPRYRVKEYIKKRFYVKPHFDAAFVPGILGYQYINTLGIPEGSIWRGMDVVDNEHFARGASEARQRLEYWQARFGLPADYFLTVGRFSPEKNLLGLIDAFSRYRQRGGTWALVMVGAGPQEPQLKTYVSQKVGAELCFLPWQQYAELPIFYGLANCLILPSVQEAWGLVVNEAMASGLPLLVSRKCGCYPELCHRGVNGFDFDPGDVESLATLMIHISQDKIDRESMGAASRRIIANYSLDTWVQALKDCIETTLRKKAKGFKV